MSSIQILRDKKEEILQTIEEVSAREEYPFKKNCLFLLNKSVSEIDESIQILENANGRGD